MGGLRLSPHSLAERQLELSLTPAGSVEGTDPSSISIKPADKTCFVSDRTQYWKRAPPHAERGTCTCRGSASKLTSCAITSGKFYRSDTPTEAYPPFAGG